jgi:hypothetical protein
MDDSLYNLNTDELIGEVYRLSMQNYLQTRSYLYIEANNRIYSLNNKLSIYTAYVEINDSSNIDILPMKILIDKKELTFPILFTLML